MFGESMEYRTNRCFTRLMCRCYDIYVSTRHFAVTYANIVFCYRMLWFPFN